MDGTTKRNELTTSYHHNEAIISECQIFKILIMSPECLTIIDTFKEYLYSYHMIPFAMCLQYFGTQKLPNKVSLKFFGHVTWNPLKKCPSRII